MPERPEALRGDPGHARARQQGLQSRVHADAVHQRQGAEGRGLDRRNGQADPAFPEELIEAFPLFYFVTRVVLPSVVTRSAFRTGQRHFGVLSLLRQALHRFILPANKGPRPIRRVAETASCPASELRDTSRQPPTRTSEAKGHSLVFDSSAAYRLEVPERAYCR